MKNRWPRWSPDEDIAVQWSEFVASEEAKEGRKHLGSKLVNEAIRSFLAKESDISPRPGETLVENQNSPKYDTQQITNAINRVTELKDLVAEAIHLLEGAIGDLAGQYGIKGSTLRQDGLNASGPGPSERAKRIMEGLESRNRTAEGSANKRERDAGNGHADKRSDRRSPRKTA